jgi:hypothetical protein
MATARPQKTDAIQLLKKDHAQVKDLFREFKRFQDEETEGVEALKQELMDEVCAALKIHTQIEEEIFYPEARECLPEEPELIDLAIDEHARAKSLIAQIEDGAASDPETCDRFLELSDAIDEHVTEEETDMFPKLLRTDMDMLEVGAKLASRKEDLEDEIGSMSGKPPGRPSLWDRLSGLHE